MPRAPRDPTGRQEGEPPCADAFPKTESRPRRRARWEPRNRPRKEGRWTRRRRRRRSPRWRTPSRIFQGHLENRTGHRKKTMRAAISHVISTRKGPLATLRTTLVRDLTRRSAHQHHPLPRPCGLRPVTLARRSTRMWRLSVDAKAPPEDRDISGFVCSAYARPTAGSEQLTWTRCSKTRSNSLTTSL